MLSLLGRRSISLKSLNCNEIATLAWQLTDASQPQIRGMTDLRSATTNSSCRSPAQNP